MGKPNNIKKFLLWLWFILVDVIKFRGLIRPPRLTIVGVVLRVQRRGDRLLWWTGLWRRGLSEKNVQFLILGSFWSHFVAILVGTEWFIIRSDPGLCWFWFCCSTIFAACPILVGQLQIMENWHGTLEKLKYKSPKARVWPDEPPGTVLKVSTGSCDQGSAFARVGIGTT